MSLYVLYLKNAQFCQFTDTVLNIFMAVNQMHAAADREEKGVSGGNERHRQAEWTGGTAEEVYGNIDSGSVMKQSKFICLSSFSFKVSVKLLSINHCESLCVCPLTGNQHWCLHVLMYVYLLAYRCVFPHLWAREDISTHIFPSQPQNGSLANTQS